MSKNLSLSIITLLVLLFSSCKKDKVQPTEISKLPEATTKGANTMGCLVNGIALLPKGGSLFSFSNPLQVEYNNSSYSKTFNINVSQKYNISKSETSIRFVNIYILGQDIVEGKLYTLGDSSTGAYASYNDFAISYIGYSTNGSVGGKIRFSKVDSVNKIVSGTFSFDAVMNTGEKVSVTDGRFDLTY